jgi:hypothetical protein
MKIVRPIVVMVLAGLLALSAVPASFGQIGLVPDAPALPPDPQPAPTAPGQPIPGQPIPGQPVPGQPIPAQPLPAAGLQPDPAAAVQPVPGVPVQPLPGAAVPTLALTRGSHIIGSAAILSGGVPIGTVQDLLSVAGSGEYALVANPSGFVMIPRSLTIFEPVPRILQVNMTFAQVGELPRLTQLSQLNRQFLQRVHGFFQSPRGAAILRNNLARNARPTRTRSGAERRAETRTVNKPPIRPQARAESHPQDDHDRRR